MKHCKIICFLLAINIFFGFDFKDESNMTAEELESGLLHELKPLSSTFIDIEEKYGINSVLYSSLVAL